MIDVYEADVPRVRLGQAVVRSVPDSRADRVPQDRPNLLLDCPDGGDFPEHNWEGRQLRIGSTTLQLEVGCPRCVMTTHGFDDLPQDVGIMRSLVQTTNGSLGIYASIIEPGVVREGDDIELLD